MGKRGPKSKPTALKVLEGNPSRRPLNKDEPKYQLTQECAKPPAWLGTNGKKEWKRILPLLEKNKIYTDADYMALAAYCQSVDTWIIAEKQKRAEGIVSVTSKGTNIQAPAVGIANTAMNNMLKFAKEFGLTPSSRTGLTAEEFEENNNPLMELMSRRQVAEK